MKRSAEKENRRRRIIEVYDHRRTDSLRERCSKTTFSKQESATVYHLGAVQILNRIDRACCPNRKSDRPKRRTAHASSAIHSRNSLTAGYHTHRNEKRRHRSLILCPSFPILLPTSLNIAMCAVHDHGTEEDRIKPRERAVKPRDQAPAYRKIGVTCVVHLPSHAIPTVAEQSVAGPRLDLLRVLDHLPGELREALAILSRTTLFGAEHVLLRVCCVPYPVGEEIRRVQGDERGLGPCVSGRRVIGQVDGAVAVR